MAVNEITPIRYDLEHISLQGLTCGKEQGEIVLCLHGWLDNAASFLPLMPYLSDKKVIAIDWSGHGLSSHRSHDAHYHFIDWVYDLLQLFEHNQWENIDIVAHSMGGMVASAFAAAFPEKVKSLTLLDSIGFLCLKEEETTHQLKQGMISRLKGTSKKKSIHPTLSSAINARVSVSDLQFSEAKLIVERGIKESENGYIWRSDSRLRTTSPYRLSLKQAQQLIKDVKLPVQLIYGDKGMDMVQLGLKHFGVLFDDFRSCSLNGGHHFHMESAKETAKLILNFID